ncbi:sigma-70 family RNA polymerase sigma factor [Novispirillum sp. DQ9]|uniref:sigma-70 family RNA polymerase sigma factor n=1 Tax=Novispirillum sp. DQ9 TaxID=3398612 RepID=UPI003C7CE027
MGVLPRSRDRDADEADLLARVAAGDREAFQALVHRLAPRGQAVAARMLGSRSDAEDVLQDALLRLWRDAGRFDQARGTRVATWFHTILVNLCIDATRRRRPAAPLDEAAEVADPRADGDRALAALDDSRRVAAALALLPVKQRAAITLCYFEGMSNADAAAVLETTVHALEALLVRARRSLRSHLEPPGEDR